MNRKIINKRKLALAFLAIMLGITSAYSQLNIQAEDYAAMKGVETEGCSDVGGGINVGWIDNSDWMEYSVSIPVDGNYRFSFRVAGEGNGELVIASDGIDVASVNIASTGAWQSWETVSLDEDVNLLKGVHTIRLTAVKGGFNLNWWSVLLVNPIDTDNPLKPELVAVDSDVHNVHLTWKASQDTTSAVAGYSVLRDGAYFAYTTDTVLELNNLSAGQDFNFSLLATDWAGNQSEPLLVQASTDTLPWQLAWSDEFDYEGKPDSDKWFFETGGHGWGNGEYQYYTDGDNAEVKDGTLIIEARKEQFNNNDFTSSRINSISDNDFMYGRVEVRAKLPSTKGSWPAIWTLPTDWVYGGWPDCGEIDIMEHSIMTGYGHVFGTVHTGAYNHQDGTQVSGGWGFDDVTDTYHTYAIEWFPDRIEWYYDDINVFTFDNEYNTYAEWPYDIPHHLILNVAIGGGLGGEVDYNGVWPQQMIIDYVRVYDFELGVNDTEAPSAPSNLKVVPSWTSVDLNWKSGVDNYAVDKYVVYVDSEVVDTVKGNSTRITGLNVETEYEFGVKAIDYSGNVSEVALITESTTEMQSVEIPGIIQAEKYLLMEGIDTEPCEDTGGGENIGWIDAGDWLTYNIDVKENDDFKAAIRVAGEGASCSLQLLNSNGDEITTVDFTVSGGWQSWKTIVSETFNLPQGVQEIKLKVVKGGFNLNWLKIGNSEYLDIKNDISSLVNIYPNPVKGNKLFIDIPLLNEHVSVVLNSMDGKILLNKNFELLNHTVDLDLGNLKAGMYVVSIITSKGMVMKKIQIE